MKLFEILFSEEKLNKKNIAEKIKLLKLFGFAGFCGNAAIQINQKIFNNQGKYVAAVNKFLWRNHNRAVGHVAVEYNGNFWDSDARPKKQEEIESWGMLDPEDSDYSEYEGWTEKTAYEVDWLEDLTEEEVKNLMPWE